MNWSFKDDGLIPLIIKKNLVQRLMVKSMLCILTVTTLTLGSRPRQGGCKGASQERDPGVRSHSPMSAKNVRA
jgi:hypothetical protein